MHRFFTGPLVVERVEVAIAHLPPALEGIKLAQLSDFHFDGTRLSPWLLDAVVAACQAAQPDLLLLTGDFVSTDPAPIHGLVPWLKAIPSRYGTYACLGNHDNYSTRTRTEVTAALAQAGISVLWNQVVCLAALDLEIIGLADFWSKEFNPEPVMAQLAGDRPGDAGGRKMRLMLSHNPDSAEYLQPWRVDLHLAGHTHGGQVVIPGVGHVGAILAQIYRMLPRAIARLIPIINIFHRTMKHWEWVAGLHRVGSNQLYVNRGLGTYFPGRLYCPPELTIITLVKQSWV